MLVFESRWVIREMTSMFLEYIREKGVLVIERHSGIGDLPGNMRRDVFTCLYKRGFLC